LCCHIHDHPCFQVIWSDMASPGCKWDHWHVRD
jgi:hypothetical protein